MRVSRAKKVVIVGGGDTGNDCVGTSIRLGAASVVQIEMMPKPPVRRSEKIHGQSGLRFSIQTTVRKRRLQNLVTTQEFIKRQLRRLWRIKMAM